MTAPRPRSRQPKQLDAGIFQAEIDSFALRLAAEAFAIRVLDALSEQPFPAIRQHDGVRVK
jgi:hypothetical protein